MLALAMRCIRASTRLSVGRDIRTRTVQYEACFRTVTTPDFHRSYQFSIRSLACASSPEVEPHAGLVAVAGGLNELLPQHCCGCGIKLQTDDKNAQGYYVIPKRVQQAFQEGELTKLPEKVKPRPVEEDFDVDDDATSVVLDPIAHTEIKDPYADEDFFDDILADSLSNKRKSRQPVEQIEADPISKMLQITCVRCHKLANEGRVASDAAEEKLPEFDLAATVGTKIARRTARRAVIAVVVDIADFDGSLPRESLLSLLPRTWVPGSLDQLPFDIVIVANKMDSLPKSVSHGYVENWVRARMKDAGLPKPAQVHLVSCVKEIGVKNLLQSLVELVGIQGDLWIIGAQNAGKSSLINAMKYHAGTRDATATLTTAPLPGTTLDMVLVEGLPLMARSRCYDTPGVPHTHQLTSRFGVEEVKNLLARDRPLKPRTYRVGANRTIFVGGVCRIDVVDFDYGTVYFTVWASDLIPMHMGKTEVAGNNGEILHKADDFWHNHVGTKLNPPGPHSKHLVPELVPVEFYVEGTETQVPQSDIAIAGLGWVSCGLRGRARLRVWTPPGVAVTRRRALLTEYATMFERPGWSQNSKALFQFTPAQLHEKKVQRANHMKEVERVKKAKKKARMNAKKGEFKANEPKAQQPPAKQPSAANSVWY